MLSDCISLPADKSDNPCYQVPGDIADYKFTDNTTLHQALEASLADADGSDFEVEEVQVMIPNLI